MSHIMEKTLATIPKLLTQSLIGGSSSKTQQRQPPSMDVQTFLRNVHRARSKSHETHIVTSELAVIEAKLKQSDVSPIPASVRGCFTKVLYCQLLGYNVNFVAIHAIKLAQQGRGFDKRLGYLMACLLFRPRHEMVLLMVGTILGDLKSPNMSDICVALRVTGELVDEEIVPFVLPEVLHRFSHPHDLVKEKAIHCFGVLYQRYPQLLHEEVGRLSPFLTSRDPGVLMAVMNVFVTLTSENPSQFVKLGPSFLHILDQINSRGFGSSYYYHMIPLPWLQISLLKVIGNIGQVDANLDTTICPLLRNLIEKTKVSVPISLAVLVESIITATKISPNEALVQLCSRCILKLLSSDSSEDMRYQGLGLLIALSRIKPSIVSQHQASIIECLTNEDHAIQSRTTLLLHAMANRANVKAICAKLFEQMEKTSDQSFQRDILMMISDLTQRLSPDVDWFLSVNFQILSHDLSQDIEDKVTHSVLRRIESICHPSQLIDTNSVENLMKTLFAVLERQSYESAEFSLTVQLFGILAPILPVEFLWEHFLDLIGRCVCEASNKSRSASNVVTMYSPNYFCDKKKANTDSLIDKSQTRLKTQCVTTVTKMVLYQCIPPPAILQWVNNQRATVKNSFFRNDLDELQHLAENPQNLKLRSAVFFQENSDIDFSLSFLDSFVIADMLKGNACYKPTYVKKQETLSQSLSSMSVSGLKDAEGGVSVCKNSDDSIMSESQTSQVMRKIPSKWRDDDEGGDDDDMAENDWIVESGKTGSCEFTLVNSDDRQLEELRRKKEATDELFAGINETGFVEMESSLSPSAISQVVSSPKKKSGKSIWDDDDEIESNDSKHSIFSVGHIGINPFGISKKPKPKSQWKDDFDEVQSQNIDDTGFSVKPLGSLNNNNNYDEFEDQCYSYNPTSFSDPHISPYHSKPFPDQHWSDDTDVFSMTKEAVSVNSSNPTNEFGQLSERPSSVSTVDALTDSDPDAPTP